MVVFNYHAAVQTVELVVANVKLGFAELGVVEEESSAEVIYRLFGLWEELVGDERHVIACLAKQFRKQRIVAPFPTVANGMK